MNWKNTFHEGLVPSLSLPSLRALRTALAQDDPLLIQGTTSLPPPLHALQGWPVEAACAIGYCGWMGEHLDTVAEVVDYFADVCCQIDERMREPAACRHFLNWFDETPRGEMIQALLPEVDAAIQAKEAKCQAATT